MAAQIRDISFAVWEPGRPPVGVKVIAARTLSLPACRSSGDGVGELERVSVSPGG